MQKYVYICVYVYMLALRMVELQTEQLEPNPFCSPRGFSSCHQAHPTVEHSWGLQGTRWPSGCISPQPVITVWTQGSHLPPGDELRSNKPHSSQ